jgi:sucrose-6-phosphate hydrolase SacC (GH32 family)
MITCYGWPENQTGKPSTNPNYGFYTSPDLKTWTQVSTLNMDGTTDCPELFEIAVDGKTADTRWIFYGGDALYFVGGFDGKTYTPESGPHPINNGSSFYASQTFNDMPAADGRRILVANAAGGGEGAGFWGGISLPVELTLCTTDEGLRLFTYPIKELATLRTKTVDIGPQPLGDKVDPLGDIRGELLDLEADIALGSAQRVAFTVRGSGVSYDAARQELTCFNRQVGLKTIDGRIRLRMVVDRTMLYLFGNDGRIYLPMHAYAPKANLSVSLTATGGEATIKSMRVHVLKSIWQKP